MMLAQLPTAVSKLAEFAAPKHALSSCGFYELQNTCIGVTVSSNITCIDRAISLKRSVTKEVSTEFQEVNT